MLHSLHDRGACFRDRKGHFLAGELRRLLTPCSIEVSKAAPGAQIASPLHARRSGGPSLCMGRTLRPRTASSAPGSGVWSAHLIWRSVLQRKMHLQSRGLIQVLTPRRSARGGERQPGAGVYRREGFVWASKPELSPYFEGAFCVGARSEIPNILVR